MGFFKRFITLDGLLKAYKENSLSGIHSYFNADALIVSNECDDLHKLYINKEYDKLIIKLDSIISTKAD